MNVREADRRLEMIRSLMDRATRWSGLPASACLTAAGLALAGAAVSWRLGLDFTSDRILGIWLGVAGASFVQFGAFTVAGARRRGEPPLSRVTWAALASMLPALFSGAALTLVLPSEAWPGAWMLCYGTAVYSLGYFAGGRAKLTGLLFLAAGALSLSVVKEHGLAMMAVSFGGLHALLGALLLCQTKENHECVLFDPVEDR